MKSASKGLPVLVITFTAVMWGISFVSTKVAMQALPPMTLALVRFLMASALLLIVLKLVEPGTRLKLRDYPHMALAGFMGVTAYFFFENNGLKLLTASAASITIATTPVFTVLADAMFFHNRLTAGKLASVLASMVGVYFVVGGDSQELMASGQGLGYIMMLGAALSWVVYSMTTRDLSRKYSMLAITCYQSLFGTLTILPFILFEHMDWNLVNGAVLLNVSFLGVFCSALGYYLYGYSLGKLGVGITSLFINLIPVVTVVASFFLLGEQITRPMLFGGMMVVGSVSVISWTGKKEEPGEKVRMEG